MPLPTESNTANRNWKVGEEIERRLEIKMGEEKGSQSNGRERVMMGPVKFDWSPAMPSPLSRQQCYICSQHHSRILTCLLHRVLITMPGSAGLSPFKHSSSPTLLHRAHNPRQRMSRNNKIQDTHAHDASRNKTSLWLALS